MDLEVNEFFDICNIDMAWLEQIKKNNNTLENGSFLVLDSLLEFCENLEDKYKDEGRLIPYEVLYKALKQVITSALDSGEIMNYLLAGIIKQKKAMAKTVPVIEQKKKGKKVIRNLEEVTEYAKTHSVSEVCVKFEFNNKTCAYEYLKRHNIEFIKTESTTLDEDKVRKVAKNLKLHEIANMFGRTSQAMGMYLLRHKIEYIRGN